MINLRVELTHTFGRNLSARLPEVLEWLDQAQYLKAAEEVADECQLYEQLACDFLLSPKLLEEEEEEEGEEEEW